MSTYDKMIEEIIDEIIYMVGRLIKLTKNTMLFLFLMIMILGFILALHIIGAI